MTSSKSPASKFLSIVGNIFVVLFVLIISVKWFLPRSDRVLSDPPIFDYLFSLGIGICTLLIMAVFHTIHGNSMLMNTWSDIWVYNGDTLKYQGV